MIFNAKVGTKVVCPPDRGTPRYVGTITHVGENVSYNMNGKAYVWVEVRHPCGSKHVWPSNRLGVMSAH